MLVQYGGGVLDARGAIGGQVHSKNRFGNYVRARTTPVNPNTNRQNDVRSAVSSLANAWHHTLSQANRDAWEVYAANITRQNKLGAQIKLTGFNHYIRSGVPRLLVPNAAISAGPIDLTLPAADINFACTVDVAAQQISIVFAPTEPWADQDLGRFLVFMSLPHNLGTNFIGGPYRYASAIMGVNGAPPASPQVMAAPFVVGLGQVVKCYARISEDDGRLSDQFFHQSSVVA